MENNQVIKTEIKKKLKQILEKSFDEISDEQELTQLGLDSMKSVALIVELEESFDIMFDDEELMFENFSTLNKISERVESKLVFNQ
ncbi:hypothetical protein J7E78_05225 [Paenibacillus polymyxa]|uniref:acyl carrier protein n=1 Tax=Paenibacillus polymyxa TaxID=1406 RepID=UPI001BE94BAC|nr:phosphopantetheine-binding protein [Paenibacillus polymyxa]MBT2282939.1 hypothetical protein [Paenibacillus polymyxa]